MGYAFEYNLGIPDSEMLEIAIMNARIRDNMLTPQEYLAKIQVKKPRYVCCVFYEVNNSLLGVFADEQTAIDDITGRYANSLLELSPEFIEHIFKTSFTFETVRVRDH